MDDEMQEDVFDDYLWDREDEPTYKIVRFYQDPNKDKVVVKRGLTLEEAQDHCSRDDTHGDGWFDGYYEE